MCEGCTRPWIEHLNVATSTSNTQALHVPRGQRFRPAPASTVTSNPTRPIEEWVAPPPPPAPAQVAHSLSQIPPQRGPPIRQSTAFSDAAIAGTQRTRNISTKRLPHNMIKKGSYSLPANAVGRLGKAPRSAASAPANARLHQCLVMINPFSMVCILVVHYPNLS